MGIILGLIYFGIWFGPFYVILLLTTLHVVVAKISCALLPLTMAILMELMVKSKRDHATSDSTLVTGGGGGGGRV